MLWLATPPHISYRTPCGTPGQKSPDPERIQAKKSAPDEHDQNARQSEGPATADSINRPDGQQPADGGSKAMESVSLQGLPIPAFMDQIRVLGQLGQNLPVVDEEPSSKEQDFVLFVEPTPPSRQLPYPEHEAAHHSRLKEIHASGRSRGHSLREDYLLGASSEGGSVTQVSSSIDELGPQVFYLRRDGLEDDLFNKMLQDAESLSDSFFQTAYSLDSRWADDKSDVRHKGASASGPTKTINSLDQVHKIYDRLLGGYHHLLRISNSARFQLSPDTRSLGLKIDPMASAWQFVTGCSSTYGRVHTIHFQGVLKLVSIYSKCGEWVTLEALLSCLVADLELAMSVDSGEVIAAARLLLLLCSMRAGVGCKEEWKWADTELAETLFHRAIIFSKRLGYYHSFTFIQKALAILLCELRKGDEEQNLASRSPGAQIHKNVDWFKIAHLLFMATICFEPGPEPGPEAETEEEWDYDDSSQDGQPTEEPTTEELEREAMVSEGKKHLQVLGTNFGLCCLFIRWRKFLYVEALLQELVPELEAELPKKPDFAINALAELASQFAEAHRWEDAKREYTRATTAFERYRGYLGATSNLEGRIQQEEEKQSDDCIVLEKLERVRETLDWGLAVPRSPSAPPPGVCHRLSLSPCETPTWIW